MGEEIAFENARISDFQVLVTLTLTLDRVILHTVMHHLSTCAYIPNFIEIVETFCGRTYGRSFETGFIRSTPQPNNNNDNNNRPVYNAPVLWILRRGGRYLT